MAIDIDVGTDLVDGTANSATEVNTRFNTLEASVEDALSFITELTDGLEFKTTNAAAASIKTMMELEWDPSDGTNLTDDASGVALDFVMPDDADNQDPFARVVGMVRSDATGAEEGELSFRGIDGGSADTEWMTVSGAGVEIKVGVFTSSTGAISFVDDDLSTTGTLSSGATTVTSLSVSDGNITNVGNIALDSISADGTSIAINNDVYHGNNTGVVVGHTSQVSVVVPWELQVVGTAAEDSGSLVGRWSADGSEPFRIFAKSRGASIGSSGILSDGDGLGTFRWYVDDGAGNYPYAAEIKAYVDGAVGVNDAPGRLSFWTTADGASSSTERMRINSSGNVGIGTTTITLGDPFGTTGVGLHIHDGSAQNTSVLHLTSGVSGATTSDGFGLTQSGYDTYLTNWESANSGKIYFQTGGVNTRLTIDSNGNVIVGTGAISTSATDGFLYIPSMAGAPSGTPTDNSNLSAFCHDTTNNRLYVYDHVSNAWQYATLT